MHVYMEKELARLSEKDFSEITENFKKAFVSVSIYSRHTDFLNWLLLQCPIFLLPLSDTTTAYASTDGKIYINPVFWAALIEQNNVTQHDVQNRQKATMDDLTCLLVHEVSHLMLRHPWSGRRILEEVTAQRNVSSDVLLSIANICMDFVINVGVCALLFPNSNILKDGVGSTKVLQNMLEQIVKPLPTPIKEMLNESHLEYWGWDDIFRVIINNLNDEQLTNQNFRYCISEDSASTGKERGVHGEKVPETAECVREGGTCEDKDGGDEEDKWKRMNATAVVEARGSNNSALCRAFEQNLEVKVPWETLVREKMASHFGHSRVSQTWMRPSRRHNDFPGSKRTGGQNLWCLADVSGSISEQELNTMVGIALSFMKRSGGNLQIVFWDTEVCGSYLLKSKADLRKVSSTQGGGGTMISPALEFVLANAKPGDSVSVCTDSAIFDLSDTKTIMHLKQVHQKYGSIIWFHFGNKNDLKSISNLKNYITPVVVDSATRLVRQAK